MPKVILWTVDFDTAMEYQRISDDLANFNITEEEFGDALMSLPGYPLTQLPHPGEMPQELQRLFAVSHDMEPVCQPNLAECALCDLNVVWIVLDKQYLDRFV